MVSQNTSISKICLKQEKGQIGFFYCKHPPNSWIESNTFEQTLAVAMIEKKKNSEGPLRCLMNL